MNRCPEVGVTIEGMIEVGQGGLDMIGGVLRDLSVPVSDRRRWWLHHASNKSISRTSM